MPRRVVRPSVKMDDDEDVFRFDKLRTPSPDSPPEIANDIETQAVSVTVAPIKDAFTSSVPTMDKPDVSVSVSVSRESDDDDFSQVAMSEEEDWMLVEDNDDKEQQVPLSYRDAAALKPVVALDAAPACVAATSASTTVVANPGKTEVNSVVVLDDRDMAKLPGIKQRKELRKKSGRKR